MKSYHFFVITLLIALTAVSCNHGHDNPFVHAPKRSIYHWRTTFAPDSAERAFLGKHNIERIYIHYFDIVLHDGVVVPDATVLFRTTPDAAMEVVPTIYITIEAMRAIDAQAKAAGDGGDGVLDDYATRIVKRVNAMNRHNHIAGVKEVQIDCDWTSTVRQSYFALLANLRHKFRAASVALSVTVRLHQLASVEPPADMGVLMLYNTGNLMSEKTHNSILDIEDVKPYLKPGTHYRLPLDYAYPVYGWDVYFNSGKFAGLASPHSPVPEGCVVRHEQAHYSTVCRVQRLMKKLYNGRAKHSTVIYHLDNKFLSLFTDEEIEHIYSGD